MNSKTYVTDPSMWENFYKNRVTRNLNPYRYRKQRKNNQIGRGLHGRYRGSYMIPVNSNATDIDTNHIPTTIVSPVAAAEERAVSERKSEKEKPHVVIRKNIKRSRKRKKQHKFSKKKIIKRKKNKRKATRKKSSKQSTSKHNKNKFRKRNIGNKYSDSVWDIKKK